MIDPRGFIEDGSLLICESSDRIFLFRDEFLHALPQDIEIAQQLGFNLTRIVEVSCERLEQIPVGETVEELIQTEEGVEMLSKVI